MSKQPYFKFAAVRLEPVKVGSGDAFDETAADGVTLGDVEPAVVRA